MRRFICKIHPNIPFPEGRTNPIFGKEGVLVGKRGDF